MIQVSTSVKSSCVRLSQLQNTGLFSLNVKENKPCASLDENSITFRENVLLCLHQVCRKSLQGGDGNFDSSTL